MFKIQGREFDATFTVAKSAHYGARSTLVFESCGGGRNREYSPGLDALLLALGRSGIRVVEVSVESARTSALGPSERAVGLLDVKLPLSDTPDRAGALRVLIGRHVAKHRRPEGAKGGGNRQKRIAIHLDATFSKVTTVFS